LPMLRALQITLLLLAGTQVFAYNNGVGKRPPLGWNTWCTLSDCHNGDNKYFDRCNEWEIKEIAQAMLDSGLHKLGFEYVNLDDCWAAEERDKDGNIQPDPDRFPSGMAATADWLHQLGLKFGLYTSMGDSTCNRGGRSKDIPGSYGHYTEDAATFAKWGMDYVKVDWCGGHTDDPEKQHTEFSHALNATGRPIWLELCRGYSYDPIPPYVAQVANSWRTTGDHQDEWSNTLQVIQSFYQPSNPGVPYAWNYGDFLMTGGPGCDVNATLHCPRSKDDEYRTAFSVWTIASSPLIVATDIRNMTDVMKQCLLNAEAIAINQDYQAPAGKLVGSDTSGVCAGTTDGSSPKCPVLGRRLTDGRVAALLINLDDNESTTVSADLTWFGLTSTDKVSVYNVLDSKALPDATGTVSTTLAPHASALLILSHKSEVVA